MRKKVAIRETDDEDSCYRVARIVAVDSVKPARCARYQRICVGRGRVPRLCERCLQIAGCAKDDRIGETLGGDLQVVIKTRNDIGTSGFEGWQIHTLMRSKIRTARGQRFRGRGRPYSSIRLISVRRAIPSFSAASV